MAPFELPSMPETPVSPALLVGAASPLWGYFGAMAAGGVAYWWMTRWTQRANLEAFFSPKAVAAPLAALEAAVEPVVEVMAPVVEAAEEVVEAAVETVAEALPVVPMGGEAAPISPVIAALVEPEPEPLEVAPEPEPVVEAVSEPVVEAVAAPEPVVEAAPEPVAETVEAVTEPEPAPKSRVRKAPPAAPGFDA